MRVHDDLVVAWLNDPLSPSVLTALVSGLGDEFVVGTNSDGLLVIARSTRG